MSLQWLDLLFLFSSLAPRLVFSTTKWRSIESSLKTWSEEREDRARISKAIKDGYTLELLQDIEVCVANGTIEQITRKEYVNNDKEFYIQFALEKGSWRIVKGRWKG